MRRFATFAFSLFIAAALAAGCTQDDGEPCQENDDCSSGLCCPTTGRAAVERGTCMPMCVVTERDAGPGTDAGVRDAGVRLDGATDAAADVDAAVDAGEADAGAGDAGGPVDAGADSGVPIDAGSDAGTDAGRGPGGSDAG